MTLQEQIRKHEWLHLHICNRGVNWDDVDRIAEVVASLPETFED